MNKTRAFIVAGLFLFVGFILWTRSQPDPVQAAANFGWTPPDPAETAAYVQAMGNDAYVRTAAPHLFDASNDQEVFLYRALEKVRPGFYPLNQGNLGSCVSFGWGICCDTLLAIDVGLGKSGEFYEAAEESIYGLARNEAFGRISHSRSAGASGVGAAKGVSNYGVIYRKKYDSFGFDLSKYDIPLCANWGAEGNGGSKDGLNGPFDREAKQHPIKTTALVRTVDELKAALQNGYPVAICSGQGFSSVRDKDGFARASGSWSHCLACLGYRDGGRPGFLIVNSWGHNWNSGPKYKDQPDGSFYAEPSVVASMLRGNDSFALSGETGFPAKKLENKLHW